MKRIHFCAGPISALLASLSGCHDGGAAEAEAEPTDFRVANGDYDSDNDFPYVAKLKFDGNGCSGILITPGLILTANHCFRANHCADAVATADYSDDDWDIKLGDGPFPDDLTVDTAHTFSIVRRGVTFTQPVIERIGDTVSTCTKEDASRDLAIMRLDQRIPLSEITPMHVPLLPGYPGCEEALGGGFEGTTIGFGECEMWNSAVSCPSAGGYPRTFAVSSGYGRTTTRPIPPFEIGFPPFYITTDLPGATYTGSWDLLEFTATGTYDGLLPGDSGGPLISTASFPELLPGATPGIVGNHGGNVLCGVASRYYPVLPTDVYPPPLTLQMGNDFAAVDGDDDNDDDNADWLAQHVIAADGNFIGECFAGDPSLPSTLELRDKDTDLDLIPDLCDPCPEYYDHDYDEGLATGPDTDGDGVPDRCDNCATVANPYAIVGSPGSFAKEQADGDNDGYGDMCDTCERSDEVVVPQIDPDDLFGPPEPFTDYACCITDADCAPGPSCPSFPPGDGPPPPPTNVCVPGDSRGVIIDGLIASNVAFEVCQNHCAFPIDTDCDNQGDLCDTCPEDFNPSQADKDNDGVGDLCDNCKGTAIPHDEDLNPECDYFSPLGDQSCQALHPDSVCLPPHPSDDPDTNVARCSLFADPDGDGVGEGCDSCTETANPAQWNNEQKNCNQVDEILANVPYPYIGDACDRNPCTTFSATKQIQSEAAEDERGWVAKIEYAPRLLPPWQEGDPFYGDPFGIDCAWEGVHCTDPRATTGLRFCSCDELGADGKPDPLECQNDGCTIDSSEYSSAGNWWKPSIWPQLATINGGNGPYMSEPEIDEQQMINPVPNDPLGQGSLLPENTVSTSSAWWYTRNDIAKHGGGETQLEGILWSHVTMVTELLPTPAAAEVAYRPWANHYKGGVFGPPPKNKRYWLDLPMLVVDYVYKGCPMDLIGLPETQDTPTMVIDAEAARHGVADIVACRTAEGDVELLDVVSDEARIALGLSSVMWVGASEPMTSPMDRMPAMAAVAIDGLSAPALLGVDSGRLIDFGGSPPPGRDAVGRVGFGAALSATERSLFIVGGVDARSGDLARDLWRYDVSSATWSRLVLEGDRPEHVLAVTYRAQDAALYVVDVAREGGLARVLRVDLSTGISRTLGEWEPSGRWDQTFLGNMADGRLLLASSSREGFVAVAFDPAEDLRRSSGPSFLSTTGFGELVAAPTLTELGLTLRVADERLGVMNVFTPMSDLLGAREPSANLIGACL